MIKIILLAILSLTVTSFEISKIIDVEGNYQIQFDSNSNCYITIDVENSSDYRFYKLDSDKNILVEANLSYIHGIQITSNNDVYIFGTDIVDTIWILQANSTELHPIFKYPSPDYITGQGTFIDNEDNILINTINGIVILKPGENIPMAIENLDGYYFYTLSTAVDQQGNIYLSRMQDRGLADIVVITSEAKNQPVPYATVLEELQDEGLRAYEVTVDSHNNIIFSVEYFDYSGKVKILRNGTVNTVLSQYRIHHYLLPGTKNRTFLIAADPFPEDENTFTCSLYFIDEDIKVHRIDRIFDLSFWNAQGLSISDRNDNRFFVNYDIAVLWVRNGDTEIKELFRSNTMIGGIIVDSSDMLWVIGDGLYYQVSLDSGDFVEFTGTSIQQVQAVKENVKTGEIYVAARDGVYVLLS